LAQEQELNLHPVHQAMANQRPEKVTIRQLWINQAILHSQQSAENATPLYTTLSGHEGHEFRLLHEAGLLQLTETGAVESSCLHKFIAIEQNATAYASLSTKFPGLKIVRESIQNIVLGHTKLRYPVGEVEKICRSKIINLDLNEPWMPRLQGDQWIIPTCRGIEKFAELHASDPKLHWTLLLTLHGECPWSIDAQSVISGKINDLFHTYPALIEEVQDWIGEELLTNIRNNHVIDFSTVPKLLQQKLLMWVVPMCVALACRQQGWAISVLENIHYGQHPEHAPMVSWIIDFQIPTRQALTFEPELRNCLETILNRAAHITPDGEIHYYNGA